MPQRRTVRQTFRAHPLLSWGTLASIMTVLGILGGWAIWVDNRYEKAEDAKRVNAQQDRDASVRGLWSQFGTTQLRSQFMEDQVYNLAARKSTLGPRFAISDEVSLQRYTKQLEQAQERMREIRRQIDAVK